jgi:hypothetical protein
MVPHPRSFSDGGSIMLGALIASLDDPKVAERLLGALDSPVLSRRLGEAAAREGAVVAQVMASAVRYFLETASEDHWVQLIGIMNRAEDPGLAAIRAILAKALPELPADPRPVTLGG